jgi:hypothetical protein
MPDGSRIGALTVMAGLLMGYGSTAPRERVAEQPSFDLSCAVFAPETTEADLVARFGAEQVSHGPVFGFDDGPQQGTVLYPQRPDARVEIIWVDSQARRWPSLIMVRGPVSRWRTPNGVALGTDIRALERANGRPFRLTGLQIEGGGGGAVVSWAGGRLERPVSGQCRNGVHLQPAYDGTEALSLMRQVRSGPDYSSAHPSFQALNPRVVLLTLTFSGARARSPRD